MGGVARALPRWGERERESERASERERERERLVLPLLAAAARHAPLPRDQGTTSNEGF